MCVLAGGAAKPNAQRGPALGHHSRPPAFQLRQALGNAYHTICRALAAINECCGCGGFNQSSLSNSAAPRKYRPSCAQMRQEQTADAVTSSQRLSQPDGARRWTPSPSAHGARLARGWRSSSGDCAGSSNPPAFGARHPAEFHGASRASLTCFVALKPGSVRLALYWAAIATCVTLQTAQTKKKASWCACAQQCHGCAAMAIQSECARAEVLCLRRSSAHFLARR